MSENWGNLNLSEIVTKLHSIGNAEENLGPWKQALSLLVARVTDESTVSSSEREVCFEFIKHCLSKTPQMFVRPSQESRKDIQLYNITEKENQLDAIPLNLTFWLTNRLIFMLITSDSSCQLQAKITDILVSLMQNLSLNHCLLLQKFVAEYVFALSDLCECSESFYNNEVTDSWQLKRFSFASEMNTEIKSEKTTIKLLEISSQEQCEKVQLVFSAVLCKLTTNMSWYGSDNATGLCKITNLWLSVSSQLEWGEVELKTITLILANNLILSGNLPTGHVINYFLECLSSLIDNLCSGQSESDGDYNKLEEATNQTLQYLLACCSDSHIAASVVQNVNDNIFKKLLKTLINHGTSNLKNSDFQNGLFIALVQLYELDVEKNKCLLDEWNELTRLVVEKLGLCSVKQYHMRWLRSSILLEVNPSIGSLYFTSAENEDRCFGKLLKHPASKRSSGASSYTVLLLRRKLLQLQNQIQENVNQSCDVNLLYMFEGIKAALQVLVFGVSEVVETNSVLETEILNEQDISSLINLWEHFICETENVNLVVDCYESIVDGIGSCLFAQDMLNISQQILCSMTWILSINWLPCEMSWMDLKFPGSKKDLSKICNKLAEKLCPKVIGKCVFTLAFFPREIASKWRTHTLNIALNDIVDVVRSSAIMCFPFFLCNMTLSSVHLISDTLHPLIKDKNQEVLSALSVILGPLACIISRKGKISRNMKSELLPIESHLIKCECKFDLNDIKGSSHSTEKLKSGDVSLLLPFLELGQSTQELQIRKNLVNSLSCVFKHMDLSFTAESPMSALISNCMCLLSDPDHATRLAYSKPLRYLLSKSKNECVLHAEVLIIEEMKQVVQSARRTKHVRLLETILCTAGYLAKYAEDSFLVLMIIVLLDNICKPVCSLVTACSHNQLKLVGKSKNVGLPHLFVKFGKKFCEIIVDAIYELEDQRNKDLLDVVKEIVEAFEFESLTHFFKKTENFLLPHLVKRGSAISTRLIKMVAKQVGDPNHKGPIYRNIGPIYCHLVCSTEPEEFSKLCQYLEEIFDKPLVELLSAGKNLEFDLLLHLASHKKQVLRGFRFYLSKLDETIEEEISTDEGVAKKLQPKLLGMLVHLDNYLNNGTTEILEKKKAYESLVTLMELMGPSRITAVRVRMMTTLKIGLNFIGWGFPELCCRAWNCFVRSIDIRSIGNMLSQIIVNLLPLLNLLPKQVAHILYYLIVEHQAELYCHFHELYFIPDIPELKDVISVLKYYNEKDVQDIKAKIESLLKGISNESKDVRQHALSKLQTLLQDNKSFIHGYVLGSENIHPIIHKIILALLDCCQDSSQSFRVLYGACLGELGAVDPGRIPILISEKKEDLHAFNSSVLEPNFGFELICKLSQAYLGAVDRSVQDFVAYAIQSLIKEYRITDDRQNTSGFRTWQRFPEDIQEIIVPLMTSRYMMTVIYEWDSLHKPIYRGGRKGFTFESWVCTLTSYLGSRITDYQSRTIFDVCRGVLRTNSHIALYLLPYAIVHVLLEENEEYKTEITNEFLAVLNHARYSDTRHCESDDLSHLSAQTIFSVLDHLIKWLRHRIMTLATIAATNAARSRQHMDLNFKGDANYQGIQSFLNRVPLDILSQASYNCGAYTRSLMYYEQFMKVSKEDHHMEQHLDFMQKLYAAMGEPDGVGGITAIKQAQPTLIEQILAYESAGQLSDALVCYDRAVKLDPDNIGLRQGLLKCRLALGELNSAMEQANGIIVERQEWIEQLNEFRIESAWKLGQWDKLQTFINAENSSNKWNVSLGRIFLAAKVKDVDKLKQQIEASRNELMGPLCAASMEFGSYQRGYDAIVQLHMLNEIEHCLKALFESNCDSSQSMILSNLMKHWEQRLELTQSSYKVQEPILNVRRAVLNLARDLHKTGVLDQEIGMTWLQNARIARECGLVQAAHSSLLSASSYNLPQFCIENAKWLWDKGDFDKAQVCLEKAIDEYYPDRVKFMEDEIDTDTKERFACAQALLLLGTYRDQTASMESTAMFRFFRDIPKVYGKWEEAYFTCAKYFDKVMSNVVLEKPEKRSDFIIHIVNYLGQSLQHGSQYIYQSMPRMLSLWLDYGADSTKQPSMESVLSLLNTKITLFTKMLPAYQFLTAFPQLISRICHTHPEVFGKLKEIIANLLVEYPQQAMWGMMAVSKSSYQVRCKRCQDIFSQAKSMNSKLNKFLLDAHKLTERLLDLCNKSFDQSVNTVNISCHFKPLQRLVDDPNFSPIMIPLQSLMTITLPNASHPPSKENHNPFPNDCIYIKGLEDTVELLSSLQRPKKINLIGSDGRNYIMLCKPKDDLRKDARLMEFNSIVNKCLHKDAESRRRNLKIRTFAVTPLNEECGMLEWVNNTASLRHIMLKLYRERGIYTSGKELRNMQLPPNAPLQKKLDIFRNKLLPRHKAIFSEWFLKTFADPTSWYNARLAYCRTVAVMSMVGYILGLGDRHGENILMDSETGECVHVDFNCLFNKGETFDYPEIVPFRLTHNMIEAMGPLGYEGIFRRACEVCLRVMRDQNDSLMSVLKSFIYDPLVEWSKPSKGRSNPTESGEIRNEKAQTHVSNIESRLKGILKAKVKGLPLSVEGHVNYLIKEATDENNLCQMYIGWASYL